MCWIYYRVFFLTLVGVFCQEYNNLPPYDHRTLHLRRRDSIPLHQIHTMPLADRYRRYNKDDDVNYRKTRDIFIDRGYDVPTGLEPGMDSHRSDRNDPMREQKVDPLREQKNIESKQSQLDKFRRELRWLTINTDEGIGIGI